jgi:hypothetical protein
MKTPHEMIIAHQQRINALNAETNEPQSALEYLQDIYKGKREPDHARMRAASLAIQYESPRLAVVGVLRDDAGFAAQLDRAIMRSAKVIELRADPQGQPPAHQGGEGD